MVFPHRLALRFFFFGAFAKLRKATISFKSIRPSICVEQTGFHWTDCRGIAYLMIFRNCVENIQVSLKSGDKNGYFTLRPTNIYDHIWRNSSYNEKCFRQKSLRKSDTQFTFNNLLPKDRLCGLVVRVSGYRYRGLGFDSRSYQIF